MTENTADQSGADERAKFEFYLTSVCLRDLQELSTNEYGEYDDDEIDASWNSWKAALASTQPAPQEPVAWIWKYANGEEEVVFIDASKRTWDYENEDVPSKITPLYATPQPFPAPAVQSGDPDLDEMTPPELLAHRLIAAWCDAHGKQISWAKAIEITAIVTKMPDAERDRLLAFGSDDIAQTAPAVAGEAWLPIETAPQGKTLLLKCEYKRNPGKGYVCVGHYIEKFTVESNEDTDNCEYNEADDTFYIQPGWYEHQYNWEEYSSIAIDDNILGWMIAPKFAAPSQGAKQNG